MKKTNKLISILIAVAMLLTMAPITVSAAETVASVTAKDGSEVGTYKTLAEAVTAAEASEDSTITLLDDVTLAETQYIYSGKFNLDLNGKTLLSETIGILNIRAGAGLTIKDSGEDGAVECKSAGGAAIFNFGTLIVESGTVKGDLGIANRGTLTVNGGTVEAVTYDAINNSEGTAYVYDGELKSEESAGINNRTGCTLYVYGGEIDGITNHATAYISGGTIDCDDYAALNLIGGTVEVTGGSFSGTDNAYGYYSGTPYGERTVCYNEGVTLTLKGGEFPGGFVVDGTTANTFLAEGYAFYGEDGGKIAVADDATKIDGYVQVKEYFAASVTDKDGSEVGTYKTFAEAVTAAQASEGSTITLLDDITLAETQYIRSGKFTLDLNGKTLLCETYGVFDISAGAGLTIKDSGEDGAVERKSAGGAAILNYGTLTVESGTVKGDGGIDNRGTLTFNGGTVESVTYSAIPNYGTAYVYDGELKSEKEAGITNSTGGTLYIYGGEMSGNRGIINHDTATAYISGGKFKGNAFAAFDLYGGTVEVTGGSFSGTDNASGSYSGTPYGERTVSYSEGATLTLKGGEFPGGFVVDGTTANTFLAEGYAFYGEDGGKIAVADDATKIDGYVQVKEYFAASVTDKDGSEVGTYKTFAEAVTAAQASEGSTITLLDDITLAETQYIRSGKFTLDLNGKTLLSENGRVLNLGGDADLTIKDSGKDGTIETKAEACQAIWNNGTLTVESGTVKGDVGIDNNGTLTFNGGTVEAVTYAAIDNSGTAYVYDGELNSEKGHGIKNSTGGTLYVYGGKIDGITNHATVYISGGELDCDNFAAFNLLGGTVEVTGGSFSGTPYGEWTVCYNEGATLTLKGGEFPNGFVVDDTTANAFLAEDYYYKDADGKVITVADDAKIINGYVKVSKGADFATDAAVTLEKTEFTYTGEEITPAVVVKVGGKTLDETNYTVSYANNINAGTAAVTVKATADSVYTGETTAEFTILKAESAVEAAPAANELTYNGEAQALVAAGTAENGAMVYSLDGAEYSEEIPAAANAGEYTVYYKVIGDSNHKDTEAEAVTVTISKKDISDGFIILGDALTYNGEEQTQTVAEFTIPAGLEVTYTVSGNKATNVGVYLLTVTGTGNFTGEAKLTFEIAPDLSKIDALTVDNVTSENKADIEAVKAQIDNASTEYASDETKAEYKAVADKCDELLAKINETAEEIKRVDDAAKGYDEDTVKSSDSEDLAQLKEDVQALIDSENTTEDEKTALEDMINNIEGLEAKVEETEAQLEEIKGIENNFNPENVSSDDKAAIEEALSEIEAVNPDNLTDEQKAEYDEAKAAFEALLEKIEAAEAKVEAVGAELELLDEERVTIFHEDEIEALKAKADELLADENMGEAETAKLEEYKAQCDNLLEIIRTPAEYFSMRLFYFVWDALNWLSSHVIFIGKWIAESIK